jgi:hypothetical protein
MKVIRASFAFAAMLLCLSGCVGVSMHSTRLVEVRLTDRLTSKPVTNAEVSVYYGYHSYGVFYLFRVPKPANARTDNEGIAILPSATFGSDIAFSAAGARYQVTPDLIRHGGFPNGSYWSGGGQTVEALVEHKPPIIVQLTPRK